jgi:hypothetical protein
MTFDRTIPAVLFLAPPSDEEPAENTFAGRGGVGESSNNPFAPTRSASRQDGTDSAARNR